MIESFTRIIRARFINSARFSLLCLLAIAVLAQSSVAQNVKEPASKPAPVTVENQIAGDRKVAEEAARLVTEFDVNGLKVLVKRRAGSQTVAAGLFLRGGSRNLTAQNAGIEDLMLESATEASRTFPRERLRNELSRMGTAVGSGVNYDYSAMTLGTTRANFDRSWEIFTDIALNPAFTEEDVARVRSRLLVELRDDEDEADSYLQVLQERAAYAGHPYANRPQGTPETMSKFTVADLKRYHQGAMQTSRLLLIIVGDLDPNLLRGRIVNSFGKLPRGDYQTQIAPPLEFKTSSIEVVQRGLPTNYIQGTFAAPSLMSEDIYAMRVASSILRDRVFEEVRVKRNLSYAPSAFLSTQGANVGGIYVTAVDANQSVRIMLKEIERLQRERIDGTDISSIVAQYLTEYYLGQETNAAQAGELAQYELIGGGWRGSLSFLERLRSVKPEDVQRVAQKYMRNIRFVVIGNPEQIDRRVFISTTE